MLRIQFNKRFFSTTTYKRSADFTHAIIGGGVVGLAIGAELSKQPGNSVVIIEKHPECGTETSSRNSEVIHAGIYTPIDSLKTKLCILGKKLIYTEAKSSGVEMRNCGKWIVAQTDDQLEYLQKIHERSKQLDVNTEFLSLSKAKEIEPYINANKGILHSPTTGIISAHSLMNYLTSIFQDNGGEIAVGTKVTGLSFDQHAKEYTIDTKETDEGDLSGDADTEEEPVSIKANIVINSAGLYAPDISNLLLPSERHIKAYYAKGNYFSYTLSQPKIQRLIYPCPTPGVASLGTHLTIDLGNQIKFGPDIEWVDNPTEFKVNSSNLNDAFIEVKKYFPSISKEHLIPTYAGIRPKLIGPGDKSFQDFVIREEEGFPGFINLLGIESPGLTSSMGIAKYVKDLLN